MSNVPIITLTPLGAVAPSEQAILTGVLADMNLAFGGNLNPSLTTPQGQLATSIAATIGNTNNQIMAALNNFDPAYASGRAQDAIGRLYMLTRIGAQATAVTATVSGLSGKFLPAGILAVDGGGNIYASTGAVTIPVGGSIAVTFQGLTTGPIACPIGYLNGIYQTVAGWDSVTNPAAGVIGNVVESRTDFEFRRKNSVALNSQGTMGAIMAAVFAVPGVLDCYATENTSLASSLSGSTAYSLKAKSIYVGVTGGLDLAVATAIHSARSACGDFNGTTTVAVVDSVNYAYPYPSYLTTFNRPTPIAILFLVQITNSINLPSNIVALTQAAILATFNGANGQRARIGAAISSGQYYAGVAAISPTVSVVEILLGTAAATLATITMGIDQQPTLIAANISVVLV